MQKPITRSTPARLYQDAVEEHDLAGCRQMADVALEVPLRLSRSVGAGSATIERRGVQVLRHPLDRAALAGRVTALEEHDERPLVAHPFLHLHQLGLQANSSLS